MTFKPYYIAPEVLKRKYDEKCDIWSCGVILYILLCGFPPFNGADDNEILENVLRGHVKLDHREFKEVSDDAKKLIYKMLEYDPAKRISAEAALNDPWFQKTLGPNSVDKPLAVQALKNLRNFRVRRNDNGI